MKKIKDLLSVVAIAKNEGEYILEWIEYHKLAGVDRIYLYDNESTDELRNKISSYINSGYVIYNFFPGKGVQLAAYNNALKKYRNKSKYMAFIDCDEFLVSKNKMKLGQLVDDIIRKKRNIFVAGIAVNWCVFGSSGHECKPNGLVIENYLYHSDYKNGKGNDCVKTIVKPQKVLKYCHPHYPRYIPLFYSIDEEGKKVKGWSNPDCKYNYIQINHYFTKSKEEWINRRSLGKADHTNDDKRSIEEFYEHDNNDVYDETLLPFVDLIKNNISMESK